jgi:Protein of unknown function (DUF1236)
MLKLLILALVFAGLAPAAHAQDSSNGSVDSGGAAGGAVGGAVGAQIEAPQGALPGSDRGLTSSNEAPFRHYVLVDQHVPSYQWLDHPNVKVGDVLPMGGVRYYDVPQEYGATHYRYTVVDQTPVLVDPFTRRIVQVFH